MRHIEVENIGSIACYFYESATPARDNIILGFHGLFQNTTSLHGAIESLRKYGSVLTLDVPGHGFSKNASNDGLDIGGSVEHIHKKIANSPYGESNLTFYGYCSGGLVALKYAARFPNQVKSIVLYAIAYGSPLKICGLYDSPEHAFNLLRYRFSPHDKLDFFRFDEIRKADEGNDISQKRLEHLAIKKGLEATNLDTALALAKAYWDYDALSIEDGTSSDADVIAQHNIPVLVIRGGLDRVVSAEQVSMLVKGRSNFKSVEKPDRRHNFAIYFPHELQDILNSNIDFLKLE